MAHYTGTSGNDSITAGAPNDQFDMSQGGQDTVSGGGGDDTFSFGAALDAGDQIDGGGGHDTLLLDGDYSSGLTFSDTTVVNVEEIGLAPGHSYVLKLADAMANLTHGQFFDVETSALAVTDDVALDASAFAADHRFITSTWAADETVIGGLGDDQVQVEGPGRVSFSGGEGDDSIFFDRAPTRGDTCTGGAGEDSITLTTAGSIRLTGKMLSGFETLDLEAGSYQVVLADGVVGAGQSLLLTAANLAKTDALAFDGSAETNGAYRLIGSRGADTIIGGAGADTLQGGNGDDIVRGGGGADILDGGGGHDLFVYAKLSDSGRHGQSDLIYDLKATDRIDLSAIDADTTQAGDQAFHLADAFTGTAGELVLTYDLTSNATIIAGDVNGDGHADLTIRAYGDHTGFVGFVL